MFFLIDKFVYQYFKMEDKRKLLRIFVQINLTYSKYSL